MDLNLAASLETDLLAAAVAALDLTPEGAPTRRAVTHGLPAADCDQVTVHNEGWTFDAGSTPSGCVLIPTLTLVVTVLRCWPSVGRDGKPPSSAVITDAALALAVDGQALVRELGRARLNGSMFPTSGIGCADVTLTEARVVEPEGGIAGWTVTVEVVGAS